MKPWRYILILFLLFLHKDIQAQNLFERFITPADTFSQNKFIAASSFTAATYSGFSIGLYNIWYKNFEQGSFQFFNDWNEWNNMDKYGHFYSAYFQTALGYQGAQWSGLSKKNAIISGVVLGTIFQTTIEIMDGFSSKWGFSVPDIAFNSLGTAAFVSQQYFWNEQRIIFKVSSSDRNYSDDPIYSLDGNAISSLSKRTDDLFGKSLPEKFIKDYNAQTIWASVNIYSFLDEDTAFPKWLNLGIGFGSEHLYGGFENTWIEGNQKFTLDDNRFPRYQQFYLGLDIDLVRLPIKNKFIRTLFHGLNIFKIPGPAIEINTLGQVKFHLIHF